MYTPSSRKNAATKADIISPNTMRLLTLSQVDVLIFFIFPLNDDAVARRTANRSFPGRRAGVVVLVLPTDEELMIAQHTLAFLPKGAAKSRHVAQDAAAMTATNEVNQGETP